MSQSVVPKKAKKAEAILNMMGNIEDEQEFKKLFKETFPKDWKRICSKYNEEEKLDKKGKGHPMPPPDTYLHNMFQVTIKKHI